MHSNKTWLTGRCFLVSLPWRQCSHTVEQATAGMLQARRRPLPGDFSQHLAQLRAPLLNIKGKPRFLPLCLCVRLSQLYLWRQKGKKTVFPEVVLVYVSEILNEFFLVFLFFFKRACVCANVLFAPQVSRENKSPSSAPPYVQRWWNRQEPLLGSQNLGASSQQAPPRMEGCCELAR